MIIIGINSTEVKVDLTKKELEKSIEKKEYIKAQMKLRKMEQSKVTGEPTMFEEDGPVLTVNTQNIAYYYESK